MKTPLYERHLALKAKMTDFSGWQLPLEYVGGLKEAQWVRENAGIFDLSHMGRITISGPDAESFLDYLSTNRISGKQEGSTTYTTWCRPDGGCIDDLIVYRQDKSHFFVIANACNRNKDLKHLLEYSAPFTVTIEEHFHSEGILAIQGPQANWYVSQRIPEVSALKPLHFCTTDTLMISTTGYTGAGGCEIFAPHEQIISLWDQFTHDGIPPIGLSARDILRLEKGYALYGCELDETIAPTESVAAWTVNFKKKEFIGKKSLISLENSSQKRSQHGIILQQRGIARAGYAVFKKGRQLGYITSGAFSPTLNRGIAIVMSSTPLQRDEDLFVSIRNQQVAAKVVPLPFI